MATHAFAAETGLDARLLGDSLALQPFEEQHFPVAYWAKRWGFSDKLVRSWFEDQSGPGILRHANIGRKKKRDYITLMISPSAAAKVYAKHAT